MAEPDGEKTRPNIHATALVVGETGILIQGPAGSGKSRLAAGFIQAAGVAGRFAALVADDQVLLQAAGGRILAIAPEPTQGLFEVRGAGIVHVPFLRRAVMHIAVAVGDVSTASRLPDPALRRELIDGLTLPLLYLQPNRLPDPYEIVMARLENRLLA
ncbi:HPr kinase/phosphorylase [Hoeflea prorocentri]|uniref:HPr kinase/phosphatase C-terminal domain-containing protein n=1 Tax=Hoeflea prorocentri TaxID=1922333 RepID=A0A9X3UKU1_9HYPH|nr:HPr kinase/phosphatase C-terminal domain-containing protein [Hoeflea prorocentri]MCY6383133.1 HPr kinase/phosphatase C-terminal domain-containing protein [Hoeflea prorocentri]MDA5400933.1 HPr kinase/phosphatase C-terminal domain-containing protein [Hoeflea prorocentri]